MDKIRLITFKVGSQNLAIPIDKVREVIRNTTITPAPEWSGLLHGVIDIRDNIIPILDLRLILNNKEKVKNTRKTRIIIVEILNNLVGLIVDYVIGIYPLTKLVPLSTLSLEKKPSLLVGVAKIEKELYLVLDIDKLIYKQEQKLFKEICLKLSNMRKNNT